MNERDTNIATWALTLLSQEYSLYKHRSVHARGYLLQSEVTVTSEPAMSDPRVFGYDVVAVRLASRKGPGRYTLAGCEVPRLLRWTAVCLRMERQLQDAAAMLADGMFE